MHILITNDDGIDSAGLWALAAALRDADHGQVTVVAPALDQSGIAMGFPPRGLHLLTPVAPPSPAYADIAAYAYDGTPVGCVTAAMLGGLPSLPDVVVSGINRGLNSGSNVMLSGTVGAAMIAALWGLPAMAISQQYVGEQSMTWDTSAWVAAKLFPLLPLLGSKRDSPRLVLNINVPRVESPAHLKGFRQTGLSDFFFGDYLDVDRELNADEQHIRYRFNRDRLPTFPATSDDGAIRAGYVSVTALAPMSAYTGIDLQSALSAME
jgi:5'-nucleotidase